jgi:excinuclease ABC subunit C
VGLFLRGKEKILIAGLEQRMKLAAERLDFEQAARARDQIRAVERTLEDQQVVGAPSLEQDVFAIYREGDAVDFVVLNLRHGKMIATQPFSFAEQEFPDDELLSSLINLYYDRGAKVPKEVIIPFPLEDQATKSQWLSELRGERVRVTAPQRGAKRRLLELALKNAKSNFASHRKRVEDYQLALTRMQERLRLLHFPRRIECYDISNLQGQQVVGSLVVLRDGVLDKSQYRRFRIALSVQDDFASLYQVLARRFRRARTDHSGGWALPDLIVVDGGKGQLCVAQAALKDAAISAGEKLPDLVALAKERTASGDQTEKTPDRIFRPGIKDPLRLGQNTGELFLLTQLRDEAHRFAISYHKKLRSQQGLQSILNRIPGIGTKRRRVLLESYGSLQRIRQASFDELRQLRGMSSPAAEAVVSYLSANRHGSKAMGDSLEPSETSIPIATTTTTRPQPTSDADITRADPAPDESPDPIDRDKAP